MIEIVIYQNFAVKGRFDPFDPLENEFEVEIELPDLFKQSYNITPTQDSLVIYTSEDKRICTSMRWGLVPFWSKDIKIGYSMGTTKKHNRIILFKINYIV